MSAKPKRQVLRSPLGAPSRRVPRRTVPAPPQLARFMNLVNAMPPQPEWKPLSGLRSAGRNLPPEKRARLLIPGYAAVIETYPSAVREFLGPLDDFDQVERRYAELERARGLLTEIASVNALHQSGPRVL